ncbi:hypothetical protein ACX818_001344 [Acinetobacter baumannii]
MSNEIQPVKHNYVNNKELYEAICAWKQQCKEAGTIVKQNDTIGRAIMLISQGLSKRFNFSGYTPAWKEEMIGDGIEASIKGLINFDETKYNNPHAYITMACFNAFVQRIKKERKQTAVKYSFFINNVYDSRDPEMASIADENFIQDIYDKMTQYEASTKAQPKEKVPVEDKNSLEFLYGEDS